MDKNIQNDKLQTKQVNHKISSSSTSTDVPYIKNINEQE